MAYNNTDVAYAFGSWSANDYETFTDNLENNGYDYAISQAFGNPTTNQTTVLNYIPLHRREADVAALRSHIAGFSDPTFDGVEVETIDISDTTGGGSIPQGYWKLSVDFRIVLTGLGPKTKLSIGLKHITGN